MTNSLLVVEGAHDAAFFAILLKARGFTEVKYLAQVPDDWRGVIPRTFPAKNDGHLNRVNRFPTLLVRGADTFGVVVSNGDSGVVRELIDAVDTLGVPLLDAIGIAIDADKALSPEDRHSGMIAELDAMNTSAIDEARPGYPLPIPRAMGVIVPGPPKMGVFVFPDGQRQGSLETVLLECAALNVELIHRAAVQLVEEVNENYPRPHPLLIPLRKGSGVEKAAVGIIANIVKPGDSLAVSLLTNHWLGADPADRPSAAAAETFLDALI